MEETKNVTQKIVSEEFEAIFNLFRKVIRTEIENQYHNAEKISKFLLKLEGKQEKLLMQLETLAKANKRLTNTLKEIVEALKRKVKVDYAR
jgi:hypothetical protein